VTIAGKVAKYHSGPPAANLFFAVIALKASEVLIQEGMKAEILTDPLILKTGRCLMRFVMSAGMLAKFPSSQAAASRFIAVIVSVRKKAPEAESNPGVNPNALNNSNS